MTGFVDKFGIYIQHIENVISDTSKHCDKAMLEGKSKQMVQVKVLLKCSIFVDILDSDILNLNSEFELNILNFSLASQYKDIDIILLAEQIGDMKLSLCNKGLKTSNEEKILSKFLK